MNDNSPFLILEQACETAVDWVIRNIGQAGLKVIRTFDLQVARLTHFDCSCPYHGTDRCDCQMVVLLVYGNSHESSSERTPVSIVAHGHNNQTWFSVVDTPQQHADPQLVAAIRVAIVPEIDSGGITTQIKSIS